MYAFDTDSISQLLRPRPSEKFLARLTRLPADQQHITSITLAELYYGAYHAQHANIWLERLNTQVLPRLQILDFDARAADRYGRLRAELAKKGHGVGRADLQTAAVVIVHGFTLVTGNVREFRRIPSLRVEDWLRG